MPLYCVKTEKRTSGLSCCVDVKIVTGSSREASNGAGGSVPKSTMTSGSFL